jgi:hypothetical protein
MTPEEHIDTITMALTRLEAALARRTADEHRLPVIEIMVETLKARRAGLLAELKRRMH